MIEKDLQLCARKSGLRGQRVVKEETDDTAHCCCELGKEKEGEGGGLTVLSGRKEGD